MLSPADPSEEMTRPPILRHEPQHRDQHEQPDHELAGARVLPEQPQPVRTPEQPDLRPVERRREPDAERPAVTAVEVQVDRDQDKRGHQALGVAERVVGDEAVGEAEADRRQHAGEQCRSEQEPAPRRGVLGRRGHNASEPDDDAPRELEHHRGGHHRAGTGDDEPHVRRGAAERRKQRREDDRQRLPRRAARRVQVEVDDLPAPHEPCPWVVARGRGDQQRERAENKRAPGECEVQPTAGNAPGHRGGGELARGADGGDSQLSCRTRHANQSRRSPRA